MSQLALNEQPVACEWCGLRPATQRIFATDACTECVVGGRKERVRASLERWKRGAKR